MENFIFCVVHNPQMFDSETFEVAQRSVKIKV